MNLQDGDYTLVEGAGWFEAKGFAIRIRTTDEGVVVDIYDNARLSAGVIGEDCIVASAWAHDNDLLGDEDENK